MADNSIDKLFEEMRAAKEEIAVALSALDAISEERENINSAHRKAVRRLAILDRTLEKHIYDEMPVLQAKMQATDEVDDKGSPYFWGNPVPASIAVGSFNSAWRNVQKSAPASLGSIIGSISGQSLAQLNSSSAASAVNVTVGSNKKSGKKSGSC